MDSLHSLFFWNRLKALQSLCCVQKDLEEDGEGDEEENEAPEKENLKKTEEKIPLKALIFIPGPDGRNNPMAIRVIKYLFKGSVGSDLFDDTLDESMELLDDLVLVIQEDSIRIICT